MVHPITGAFGFAAPNIPIAPVKKVPGTFTSRAGRPLKAEQPYFVRHLVSSWLTLLGR